MKHRWLTVAELYIALCLFGFFLFFERLPILLCVPFYFPLISFLVLAGAFIVQVRQLFAGKDGLKPLQLLGALAMLALLTAWFVFILLDFLFSVYDTL